MSPDEQLPDPQPEPRRRREPVFNLPRTILALAALCIAVHAVRTLLIDPSVDRSILINFAFFPIRYEATYLTADWQTLVTPISYSFLHGDWLHLGVNMIWLAAFATPLVWRLGVWRTVVLWVITSIGAAGLHLALYWGDTVPLIGASGAVSGFMGAAARFGFRANRTKPRQGFSGPRMGIVGALRSPGVFGFLLVWMVVNYLAGAGLFGISGDNSIAWEAHIGGLLAGYFLIGLIDRRNA